jgi:hypothetical protein
MTPITPVPALSPGVTTIGPTDFDAQSALRDYAVSEETYYAEHGGYTADVTRLDLGAFPVNAPVQIVRADQSSYCLQSFSGSGATFTYDSNRGAVTSGLTC